MGLLARAIVTGFGFTLGAALFKRVQSQLGLDDDDKPADESPGEKSGGGGDADGDGEPDA